MNVLLVALGGALGSTVRYFLSGLVLRSVPLAFPLGTFLVNLLGCLVFGLIAGAAEARLPLSAEARVFLFTGVLGGFTTFSSYAFESVALMRAGEWTPALINLVGQVVCGTVALWIGMRAAG